MPKPTEVRSVVYRCGHCKICGVIAYESSWSVRTISDLITNDHLERSADCPNGDDLQLISEPAVGAA